jgi:hypothetical protein
MSTTTSTTRPGGALAEREVRILIDGQELYVSAHDIKACMTEWGRLEYRLHYHGFNLLSTNGVNFYDIDED